MKKKAQFDFLLQWAEFFFFFLLVIGVIISLISGSVFTTYVIMLIVGMMTGRLFYKVRHHLQVPWVLVVLGLLLGLLVGARYGTWKVSLIMFIIGNFVSYYLHMKGYIRE